MSEHHARQLAEWDAGQGVTIWVASCSCGWGGKAYTTKRDAAAAWGHHNAAAQRRGCQAPDCTSLVCHPVPRPERNL